MAEIKTIEDLRAHYGDAKGRSIDKQLSALDKHCKNFVALSPFLVMGTSAKDGLGDVSPRGDFPGFVKVLDDKTILIPDRPGNNRLDSLSNIVENPVLSLVFLVPGVDETLRVNGTAVLDDDEALLKLCEVDGKLPKLVIKLTVHEAYLHCAKALMRSKLWSPESLNDRSVLPTMSQMLKDHTKSSEPVEDQAEMVERYKAQLY